MQTIETFIPVTLAKAKLLDMVRTLSATGDTVAITKNGVPEVVMLSMKKFEGLMETLDILADPEMMLQFRSSVKDAIQGNLVDMEEVFKDEV